MTDREFKDVIAFLVATWHHFTPSEEALAAYRLELGDLDVAQATVALRALAREGMPRMPTAGQVRQKVVLLQLDPPSWAQALRQLHQASVALRDRREATTCPDGNGCGGTGWLFRPSSYRFGGEDVQGEVAYRCSCPGTMARGLGLHPIVESFVALIGWGEIRRMLVGGTTEEAQTREKWEQHVRDQVEHETLRGLGAPGLGRLERAEREEAAQAIRRSGSGDGGLEQLGDSVRRMLPTGKP